MYLEDRILQAIKNAMPSNAEFCEAHGNGAFYVGVSWKLNNDPERPNKMSKPISIRVSIEAAQDFSSASAQVQEATLDRLVAFLSEKLTTFDPEHNVPKHEAPPVEEWIVSSSIVAS